MSYRPMCEHTYPDGSGCPEEDLAFEHESQSWLCEEHYFAVLRRPPFKAHQLDSEVASINEFIRLKFGGVRGVVYEDGARPLEDTGELS